MKIERVALVVHDGKPEAVELAEQLAAWLGDRGIAVDDEAPDLVVSLGGDGTVLRAAQAAHAADVPLLGVNLGALGYLTEVEAGEGREALERVLDGSFKIEERMMLACDADGDSDAGRLSYVGLNEVLVERTAGHRLVRLAVRVGEDALASFNADGVIVATPTGSTAYALSAGGPIVSPKAECLVLVPVSAHMIFSRPFVLAPDETVSIRVDQARGAAALSLDGALGGPLKPGATVTVRRHRRRLKFVKTSGPGFIERLRIKLDLPAEGHPPP